MRIVLADDHTLFREGLAGMLLTRPDIEVVGCARAGCEAVELARRLHPDIVLMDVRMPGIGGVEAARRIHALMPDVHVVMLTMSEDEADLFEAIRAGAQGYILKNVTIEELFRFLDGVMAGEASISGLMAAKLLKELAHPSETRARGNGAVGEPLSERELDVLHCLAAGLSNREIAEQLSITENTVKKHLRHILAKLHLQNRVQAAIRAQQIDESTPLS